MAPFRPTNINKRAYPGNASIIGPTSTATLGLTTTTCCSSIGVCDACSCQPLCLGCRCSFCACPCCNVCCSCDETLCSRTIPSGMWKSSEQYEARKRDAWGDNTCSCGTATCLCCTNVGFACTSNLTDYKGFFFCCGPSTQKWFSPPNCTEIRRTWYCRNDAVTVANNCMGSCGWFFPDCDQLRNWYDCRTYVDAGVFGAPRFYTSSTECAPDRSWALTWHGGGWFSPSQYGNFKSNSFVMRAQRCIT